MDLADVPRHRPFAFDKMEALIKEMQDPETGVPVRSQKLFLTYIPAAFMGYDLVEWLMERFNLDETSNVEAINLANQLCQFGYFFPVNDSKNLVLKDDSSLYRFQSPYYWPWQSTRPGGGSGSACAASLGPDNVEYAIYLVKRTLRNKQRHGLEDYELEALANLKKNLAAKWDFITMQAEEQVRVAKDRKKGDKIVSDSQERAYWRVVRPPPGVPSALEACPVPVRARAPRNKQREIQFLTKEIEFLKSILERTCVKSSVAAEGLVGYAESHAPYDPWITPPLPNNPWVTDDTTFWQINSPLVDVPSEKRVQRWALSIEELVSDPTGLQEFTNFLRKEYSHENIRFWLAVVDLRRSSAKQIPEKLQQIYEEFLKSGAPCEINIDGATAEQAAAGVKSGSRFAFDQAADHVFNLLLKKDCYPRFVRSEHFQRLLAEGRNVHQKKAKFFNFGGGGQVKKKPPGVASTVSSSSGGATAGVPVTGAPGGPGGPGAGLGRRRGSERSLSGSAHELTHCAARTSDTPSHSHSQSNLADIIPFREGSSEEEASTSEVSRGRRLPQQSTLDGGLRGAAPPLRRLSAVDPRTYPLPAPPSPPSPHTPLSPAPPTQPAPCAVSIDVTTPVVTPPSDTPLCTSVSTCVTPPTPPVISASVTASSLSSITEADQTTPSSSSSTTPVTTTAISLTEVNSPSKGISTSPIKTLATVEASTSSPVMTSITVTETPGDTSTVVETSCSHELRTSRTSSCSSPPASSSSTALCVSSSATSAVTTSSVASVTVVATPSSSASTPSVSCGRGSLPSPAECGRVAPLAECEVTAGEEKEGGDHEPVVPSPPDTTRHDTDVINIAHKDELSKSEQNVVKLDNNSSDCKQRNDICPWEDE